MEDATLTILHTITQHLQDTARNTVKILVDFSSAFNTIQPHANYALLDLKVNLTIIVLWIKSFLSNQPHRVAVRGLPSFVTSASRSVCSIGPSKLGYSGNIVSNETVLNTGAPQGCVLSHVLFSPYTSGIRCNDDALTLVNMLMTWL